jgi:hypothetical protein
MIIMGELLVDIEKGKYTYCEQCADKTFHLRILDDNYVVIYVCERCYIREVRERCGV